MILITGTGQSGTTAFLELLSQLGRDRGNKHEFLRDEKVQYNIEKGNPFKWPDVIKHLGGFCYNLNEHIDRFNWEIEHIFIVLRDLENLVRKKTTKPEKFFRPKALGITREECDSMNLYQKQEIIRKLARDQIGALMFNILEREYPFTIVKYPKFAFDIDYCYNKVSPVIECSKKNFIEAHKKAIDLERVNRY